MDRRWLWGILGVVALLLLAAIFVVSGRNDLGVLERAEPQSRAVTLDMPVKAPRPIAEAAGPSVAPRAVASKNDGQTLGISVAISFAFSLIAAFAGGWLGRRKLLGELSELRSDMDRLKLAQSAERTKEAADQANWANSPQHGTMSPQQAVGGFSPVPRSKPTGWGMIPPADNRSDHAGLTGHAAPPPADPPAVPVEMRAPPPVDPHQAANQAVADFQNQFQQFLAGANVSQKAYDSFVSQFGRTRLVHAVEGGQVQLASEAMGTEKLLALQLNGHDRIILLPSFYFISDFSSSFAKSRDVPREIKAAYDIVAGGSGQLRINRLGLVQQQGDILLLAEPRGELAGFID